MREEAIQLLEDLLNIPSVNSKDEEGAVADYLADYFRTHGVECFVQSIDRVHKNIVAFVEGTDPKEADLWNGHLDTVAYGELEKWSKPPGKATIEDGKIYARGASDMKSGLAAMVYALTHLEQKPPRSIWFVGTCDEEKNGLGASWVLEEPKIPNYRLLLIGEPTHLNLGIAQKGCLWLKIVLKGKTSHGAYPQEGINAIHYLYRLSDELIQYVGNFESSVLGKSTAQINLIQGGVAPNMTADNCEATLDIRMVPGLTKEMILEHGKKILEKLQRENRELQAEWIILNDRRAFEIASDDPAVAGLRHFIQKRGYEGKDIGINFFTDASVLARNRMEQKVILFGPGDPRLAHKPDEYVEIEYYLKAIEILKDFVAGK